MIRTYVDSGSGSYVLALGVVIAIGVVWTLLVRRARAKDAAKAGDPRPESAPTSKLWWGGILLAYALIMLVSGFFNPLQAIALVGGIVLLGLGFQDRRNWHTRKAPDITAGWHDDPESPTLLRYHDGNDWTERTASKGEAL